jgi:hypothetical protein
VISSTPSSVLIVALLTLSRVTGATEFGGGTAGPDSIVSNVLSSLSGRPGFQWIRSPSPRVPEFGFRGVSDVRLHVPRSDRPSDALPEDLFETYRACRNRLPSFPGAPAVWEVWNEPDFYFVRNSAADMAATLKAAWWGIKAGHPDAQVLMPSLAFRPGRYALELAVNGLASWTDGWNIHFYGWAADYPAFLAHQRAFADAIGCHQPIWVTEIGHLDMPVTVGDDPAALSAQAAFHERTLVESWARGVDRHLLFLLTPYREARSDLGLTTSNGMWRPAMTSAAQMVRTLQGSRPVYRLVHRPTQEDIGIVLERDTGTWWTILWSPARPGDIPLPGVGPAQSVPDVLRVRPTWPRDWTEVRVGIAGETALAPSQLPEFHLTPEANVHLHGPPVRFGLSDCRWVPWSDDDARAPMHRASVAAGVPPAVEGGASRPPEGPSSTGRSARSAGQDARLYGRRDARRYELTARAREPCDIETVVSPPSTVHRAGPPGGSTHPPAVTRRGPISPRRLHGRRQTRPGAEGFGGTRGLGSAGVLQLQRPTAAGFLGDDASARVVHRW